MKSGRYSPQALKDDIYPKCEALKAQIRDNKEAAIKAAKAHIFAYRADVEKMNDLDPGKPDDLKLLQAGIPLTTRDIKAILERSKSNRTMTQLALRYAKEHGIDTGGVIYIGGEKEAESAGYLEEIVDLFAGRMQEPGASALLDKFFERHI